MGKKNHMVYAVEHFDKWYRLRLALGPDRLGFRQYFAALACLSYCYLLIV